MKSAGIDWRVNGFMYLESAFLQIFDSGNTDASMVVTLSENKVVLGRRMAI